MGSFVDLVLDKSDIIEETTLTREDNGKMCYTIPNKANSFETSRPNSGTPKQQSTDQIRPFQQFSKTDQGNPINCLLNLNKSMTTSHLAA